MRTRVGLEARMEEGFRLFIQPQDVRMWGEETNVRDPSADAVDVHQAYLEVDRLPGIGGLIRAGRQEVALGESRLMGAPNWGQAGQAFDGARWLRPSSHGQFEALYLQIREGSSPNHDTDSRFVALSWLLPIRSGEEAQAYAVHNADSDAEATRQTSVGGIWRRQAGPLALRVQGIYQFGERQGSHVEAYLLAGSGRLEVLEGRGSVTLWYDRLSGDDDPDDGVVKVFSTLFGARNRYYGTADYFLDIPSDTGGQGLQDAALKLAYTPSSLLSANVDLHSFRTAAEGPLSSRRLGEELDTSIRYRFRQYLTVWAGYSVMWGGPAMAELDRLAGTGTFGYLMTSLRF